MGIQNKFFYAIVFIVIFTLLASVHVFFTKKDISRNHTHENVSDALVKTGLNKDYAIQVEKKARLVDKSLTEKINHAKLRGVTDKQELLDLIYDISLTPSSGLELLKYIEDNVKSLDIKVDLLSSIISSLASNGYLDDAWNMISEDLGRLRYSQITYFFTSSQEPHELLLSRFSDINDVTDRTAALDGICNRLFIPFSIGNTTALMKTDFSQLGNLTDQQKMQISSYFIKYGASPSDDGIYLPERTLEQKEFLQKKSLELANQGIMNLEDLRIVLRTTNNNAFDNWELMKTSLNDRQHSKLDMGALSQQVRDMTEQDPIKTLEMLQQSSSQDDFYWIEVATKRWLEFSVKDAGQWYSTKTSSMRPEHRERVALAYLRVGIQEGDLKSASLWAEHIVNPDLKSVVEAEIRDALTK